MSKKSIQVYKKESRKNVQEPLKIFIAVAPFLAGVYYEWASCLVCVFLLAYLWYCFNVNGEIRFCWNLPLITAIMFPVAYGVSALWAVDFGMAFFGMVRFLPLPIFVLAMEQNEKKTGETLVDYVPISGMIMVVLSWILGMIPVLDTYFIVNDRLAGFFQYPNTFALYLLIGIIVLAFNKQWTKINVLTFFVLFLGILLTGSRTGFILLLCVLIFCFSIVDKRIRLRLLLFLTSVVLVCGIYVIVSGNMASIGRFLTTSFSSSTFLGRILYYKDAVPVILSHPFGLGYMGYYFTQGAFQTGVYSVINIHNELLQFLLDIGWIPTVILIWTIIKGLIAAELKEQRMIIIFILLHSMLDFNLQFLSIFMILFAVFGTEEKKPKIIKKKGILIAGTVLSSCISLYFGMDSSLYYLKEYQASADLYPGNTNAWMQLLTEAEDADSMDKIAEIILVMNPNNPLANNAKARTAYAAGDFGKMITYKEAALKYNKYNLEDYLDYINMLYVGYQLYMKNGDTGSAEVCRKELLEIPKMLDKVQNETDPLAFQINDKPELELPQEYQELLGALE